MAHNSKLFKPLKVGTATLQHRLVMAPLTRFRSDDDHVPILPMAKEYYAQRGSVPGTLLVTEGTFISPQASGYDSVPGLWTDAQLKAWKEITDAVHAKGSFIYCQLWALGRAATKKVMDKKGLDVVSSSAVPISEKHATPKAMKENEIVDFIAAYGKAAKNAVEVAGFDGVEIHGANGYIIDQFTQDNCNKRTDRWGGSIENRSRFALEVAKSCVEAVGADKVGIRLSPFSSFQAMKMADPISQFSHLVTGLKELKLAYLHMTTPRVDGPIDNANPTESLDPLIHIWGKTSPILLAGGFTAESAVKDVDEVYPDLDIAVVFGRYFISTPDLPFRVQQGLEFTKYDRPTFYKARSPDGYIDYPFSKEWQAFEARL